MNETSYGKYTIISFQGGGYGIHSMYIIENDIVNEIQILTNRSIYTLSTDGDPDLFSTNDEITAYVSHIWLVNEDYDDQSLFYFDIDKHTFEDINEPYLDFD